MFSAGCDMHADPNAGLGATSPMGIYSAEELDELFLHLIDVDEHFVEPEWPEPK